MFNTQMLLLLGQGIVETLFMTLLSTLFAYVLGLPLGVVMIVTADDGIHPVKWLNKALGVLINVIRSVPFLILLFAIIPFTRLIVGTTIGSKAMIVPLVVSAAPFIARMVESSLKEVDPGVIEAATACGATPWQIVTKVLLPEALPSLINGAAIAITTILGYGAMAGIVGGGGLGGIAINYGYYRGNYTIMIWMVLFLVVIVQVFQSVGNTASQKSDKRTK